MLQHFLDFLRCLLFETTENEIYASAPPLPRRVVLREEGFVAKGTGRHFDQLLPILPYLKSFLPVEGLVYDADDNVSVSRSCLPLQPLGMSRIHIIRFLCNLIFRCRGVEGADVVERFYQLDFIGDMVELFFAYKWNSLMHCTLEFFTQVILRRAFNFSPFPSSSSDETTAIHSTEILDPHTKGSSTSPSSPSVPSTPLHPYAKILHQMLVKHRFIERLLTTWEIHKTSKGKPGFRRAGYMGQLQNMALRLTYYFHPSLARSVGYPRIKDTDVAALDDEALFWEHLESHYGPFNVGGNDQMTEETSSVKQLLSLESELRERLLMDLPKALVDRWTNFIVGDLRQAFMVSNVEHLRNLKSLFAAAPSQIDDDSPNTPYTEAALQAYNRYRAQPLTVTFEEDFGFRESEFTIRSDTVEEVINTIFSDLGVSLILQEYTANAALFDEICNTTIKAPDGVEVGSSSAGWPVVCADSTEPKFPLSIPSPPLPKLSTKVLPKSRTLYDVRRRESVERLVEGRKMRSIDWLNSVFDETHTEIMLESEELSASEYETGSQEVVSTVGIDYFRSALSSTSSDVSFALYEEESEEEEEVDADDNLSGLTEDLRSQLALVPEPRLSDGRPTISVGQRRRLSWSDGELLSGATSPPIDRWPVTSRSSSCLNSPDLPDLESLVLPRVLLDRDTKINSSPFQQDETLPQPIQPTMRSHRLSRTALLKPVGDESEGCDQNSGPIENWGLREQEATKTALKLRSGR